MPRKFRAPKQRYDAKAELEAWSLPFECGVDYFRETGCVLPIDAPPEDQAAAEQGFRAAAHPRGFVLARCFSSGGRRLTSGATYPGRKRNLESRHANKEPWCFRAEATFHAVGFGWRSCA